VNDEAAGATFEAAIAELESIVGQLDAGQLSLEESLRAFERGVALQRHCMRILSAAQQQVEVLNEAASTGLGSDPVAQLEGSGRASLLGAAAGADGQDPFAATDPAR
jgi:exodeoxyribonuclease VII small subunit